MKYHLAAVAFLAALFTAGTLQAQADEVIIIDNHGAPRYTTWQAAWDRFEYDRHHVMLGTVAGYEPYRLQIARRDGNVQMIDLKRGTVILPTGATPMVNERIAVIGYYSHGTFIANRVIIHA